MPISTSSNWSISPSFLSGSNSAVGGASYIDFNELSLNASHEYNINALKSVLHILPIGFKSALEQSYFVK